LQIFDLLKFSSYLCTKNIFNMASIQDIRAMELRITDIVDDYVKKMYNEDYVLAIAADVAR